MPHKNKFFGDKLKAAHKRVTLTINQKSDYLGEQKKNKTKISVFKLVIPMFLSATLLICMTGGSNASIGNETISLSTQTTLKPPSQVRIAIQPKAKDTQSNVSNFFQMDKQKKVKENQQNKTLSYDEKKSKIMELMTKAKAEIDRKNILPGVALLYDALKLSGNDNDIRHTISGILTVMGNNSYTKGEYEQASAFYKEALPLSFSKSELHNKIGMSFQKMSRYETANYHYTIAVHFNKNNSAAFANIGSLKALQKNYIEAIPAYEKALKLGANKVAIYNNLGSLYANNKDYNKAITTWNKALKADPECEAVKNNLKRLERLKKS